MLDKIKRLGGVWAYIAYIQGIKYFVMCLSEVKVLYNYVFLSEMILTNRRLSEAERPIRTFEIRDHPFIATLTVQAT